MSDIRRDDRVLVTGATGVLGMALMSELKARGYEHVIGVSSSDCDLRRERRVDSLFRSVRPQVLFHLAARVYGIMGNQSNRAESYLDNVRINTNVLEACRRTRVRKVIAMGSTAMYSDEVPLPMKEESVWFGPPHASEAPYAHAKRAMLAQLEAYREDGGPDFALAISTNLFGPHDRFDERWGHVVPSLISKIYRAVAEGDELCIWGTGTPERDFLYSADAAHALLLIAESHSGAINVASGVSVTIRDLVNILVEVAKYTGKVSWDDTMPDGQLMRRYDVSRLRGLGFAPRYQLGPALATTFGWYAEHHNEARR